MNQLKLEKVQKFCVSKGVLIDRLSLPQKDYAQRLLEKYTWQTSARYIALVCHPKYGTGSNVASLLEEFYNTEEGQGFKEPQEEINQINLAIAKEFDPQYVENKIQKTPLDVSTSSKKIKQISVSETEEIRQLLASGVGMQRISDRYNCSLAKIRNIRDDLRSSDPDSYQVVPKKNRGKLCVKNNFRKKIIKKCISDYPDSSFYQITKIAKAGASTVMSAWIEMIEEKTADTVLIKNVNLPNRRFTNHRQLAKEEVDWALKKHKQGWTIDSVAYALKIHVNCLLKYLEIAPSK